MIVSTIINDIRRDIKRDIKIAMKMRLPWWALLSISIATLVAYFLLDSAGRGYLTLPALASGTAIGFTIAIKWNLKPFLWFWTTMVFFTVVHALLILSIPWASQWVPALVTAMIASVDVILMFALIDAVGRLMKRTAR